MASGKLIHKKLQIGGMTCVHCQEKIQRRLRGTDGVVSATVSYTKGTADITYDSGKLSLADITRLIEKLDYRVLPEGTNQRPEIGRMVCTLALILVLYVGLQQSGLLNLLVPSQLADSSMGYGMLFVIGLVTSVHCVAMCGGIGLSQSLPRDTEPSGSTGTALLPAVLYNLGRVISYTLVGFLLGAVGFLIGGGQIGLPPLFQGVLKLIAGAFMVVMGINMLGLFPWLRGLTLRPPKYLTAKLGARRAKAAGPLAVGLLNGLMPCGPLQSMQIVALASGSPFAGALSMFLFSLGTVPLMLGLGSLVAALGKRFAKAVNYVGAILVAVLGLAMLSQGASLSGLLQPELLLLLIVTLCALGVVASLPCKKALRLTGMTALVCIAATLAVLPGIGSGSAAGVPSGEVSTAQPEGADAVQLVTSTLSARQYPTITVQAGTPVEWVINAPAGSINGCNYKMLLQEYGVVHTFQEGENVIEFTPTEPGTYQYSCWMGMIRGLIHVTDPDGTPDNVSPAGAYRIPSSELAIAELTADENGDPVQQVTIRLTETGFQPAVVVVQKNIPVLWTIRNSLATEGGSRLLAPYYSTALDLTQGDNPLSLYPTGSFAVSTGDSAFFAYVKVVEDISQLDADAIRSEVDRFETVIYPSEIYETGGAGSSCCS